MTYERYSKITEMTWLQRMWPPASIGYAVSLGSQGKGCLSPCPWLVILFNIFIIWLTYERPETDGTLCDIVTTSVNRWMLG